MKCCVCKEREATVHLTQIVGDKMQKLDLCEECARSKGVNDPTGFSLADLLLGLGASQEMEQATKGGELKCPQCGFSQADFKKLGRFGCPECYETFSEGLDNLLKTMHKGTRHVGKVPAAFSGVQTKRTARTSPTGAGPRYPGGEFRTGGRPAGRDQKSASPLNRPGRTLRSWT